MDPKELFKRAVKQATPCIKRVERHQLTNSTPCTEWNVRDLLNHMVYEVLWVPDLLAGKTAAEVGDRYEGDVLGDDPAAAWERAVELALAAVELVDPAKVVHLSYADKTAADYILEVGGDIFIHTWDLDQGLHCTLLLDNEIVQIVYDNLLPRKEELAKSSLFAAPIELSDSASIQDKLIALTGRKPRNP
jgi:uncharacterized protein (TIGR03086 family)